jgi:hypothetical protein
MAALVLVALLLTLFFATLSVSTAAVARRLLSQARSVARYRRRRSASSARLQRPSRAA